MGWKDDRLSDFDRDPDPGLCAADAALLGGIPVYPVLDLCGPIRDFVRWADDDGLHPETAAPAALAAVASLCAAAAMADPLSVRPSLWLCVVGKHSTGKSPARKHAFEQVKGEDALALARWREDHEAWKASKARHGAAVAGKEPPRPAPVTVSNATLEQLERNMERGTAAIVCDELAAFLRSLGVYRGKGDGAKYERSVYRQIWSGAPVDVVRVGSDPVSIDNPCLTIFGPLLPDETHLLGSVSDGDWARWLPSRPPPETPVPPERHKAKPASWVAMIDHLLAVRGVPRTWTVAGEAYQMWRSQGAEWRRRMAAPDQPEHVAAALSKAGDQACRLALVFAESLRPGHGGEVPVEAMAAAVAVVEYSMAVWASFAGEASMLSVSQQDRALEHAVEKLAAWLEALPPDERGERRARRGDLQRAHVGGVRRAEQVDDLIQAYEATYGESVVERSERGVAGRPTVWVKPPPRRAIEGL